MRNQKMLEPALSDLTEFSTHVWRELWAYTPEGRRARVFTGIGVSLSGVSVISLVLYGIYRGLGALLIGPTGPVPVTVWVASAAGVFAGSVLLGIAAVTRWRRMRVPRFTTRDTDSVGRGNGHSVPIRRGSRNS